MTKYNETKNKGIPIDSETPISLPNYEQIDSRRVLLSVLPTATF